MNAYPIPLAALAAALLAGPAQAQEAYKCKTPSGYVYQDTPCRTGEPIRKTSGTDPAPASTAPTKAAPQSEMDRQKAFLADGAKRRRVSDLRFEIGQQEEHLARMNQSMQAELAAIDSKAATANNNLAGATYLQSLATERQATVQKWDTQINQQRDVISRLRADLSKAQE